MRRTSRLVLVLATAAAVVSTAAACADGPTSPDGAPTSTSEPTGTPSPIPTTEEPTVPEDAESMPARPVPAPSLGPQRSVTGEVPEAYLERVVADAAERAGVAPSQVEVLRAQQAQWRDGSLGCPRSGESYIQVIVDGYWIELAAGGKEFDYRLDGQGNFRLCDQPNRQPPYGTDR